MDLQQALEICPTTTYRKVFHEGALMVDVREQDEVVSLAFDVPEIMVVPLSEFEERFQEIPKDREIVMVCSGGTRSLKTTYFLMNHGYERVYNMSDGIIKWHRRGFPLKGDPSVLENTPASGGCCGTQATEQPRSSCCNPSETSCC